MNTQRTTSPRVRGRGLVTLVVGLVLAGSGLAPQALATPHVPEPGRGTVYHLTVAQLRREAAADRAQHLRWMGGSVR